MQHPLSLCWLFVAAEMVSQSALFAEVWTEYGISMVCMLLRFFARWRVFGFKAFDLGDVFAALAMIFYSIESTGIYLLTSFGNNIGMNAQSAMEVPDWKVPDLTLGSKLAFLNWFWYINLIWCLKGILLMVYVKLGTGVARQELLVKGVCVFNFCTWLACILTHTLICTPPHKSWQIKPYPGDNCTMRKPNYYVIAILNSLTDLAIIMVPMPLLFKVKVRLSRKLVLIALFSLGFFVITATILRAHYSLHSLNTLPIALGWASRETFVATVVACAPGIKPLFSTSKWYRSTSDGSRDKLSREPRGRFGFSAKASSGKAVDSSIVVSRSVDVYRSGNHGRPGDFGFEMGVWRKSAPSSSGESDERVMIQEEQPEVKADDNRSAYFSTEQVVRTKDQV
ncbi:hypothetical protein AC578_739 [Pseudocercospora eumusae]|uniref:Rhodopsin domain-containing protein n=1 Tax=Pseudocercospora eumusae TaxID=321146 RepID=A0A139HMU5_9PEZI|nr:hypothetical protein AC578_739 [Pseudocercospora eumusae]